MLTSTPLSSGGSSLAWNLSINHLGSLASGGQLVVGPDDHRLIDTDGDGVADVLHVELGLPPTERRARMRRLRRAVREYDIYHWLDTFLEAAIAKELADFPRVEDYLPASVE